MRAYRRKATMALRPSTAPAVVQTLTVLRTETPPHFPVAEESAEGVNASPTNAVFQETNAELSENDADEWKLWYRNLKHWNFEEKSLSSSSISERIRRDSVIEPRMHTEFSASNCGNGATLQGKAASTSSLVRLFPPPPRQRPLQILSQLRSDVGMPTQAGAKDTTRSTVDGRQPGTLAAELEALRAIISTSLESQSKIPLAIQFSLTARLERVVGLIEKRRYWDRSRLMSELDQQAGNIVTTFVQLINPLQTCIVCGVDSPASTYSAKITMGCDHVTNTCNPCLAQWVAQQLIDKGWDKIKCSECPELLTHSDVRSCASLDTFERFDALAARSVLQSIEEFCWCLNPSCKAGQIHSGGARFECSACSYRFCIKHNTAWHQNETCQDYDKRRELAKLDDEACEEWKSTQTKICSECNVVIEKNGGCDHMTCAKCYASFSWEEASPYVRQEFEPPQEDIGLALARSARNSVGASILQRFWAAGQKPFFSCFRGEKVVMDYC